MLPFTEITGDMSTEARRELLVGTSDLNQLLPNIRKTHGPTLNNDPQPIEDIDLALSLLLRTKDHDHTGPETGVTLFRNPLTWVVATAALALGGFAYVSSIGETDESPASSSCDPNYQHCVPVSPDLSCSDIKMVVRVIGIDIHGFDRDGDLLGCEIYQEITRS